MPFDWVTAGAVTHFKNAHQQAPLFPLQPEYGFGWWYAYFWNEVRAANAPLDDFKSLLDMIYDEPDVDVQGLNYGAAQRARTTAAIATITAGPAPQRYNDWRKRRILRKLLDMGFTSMPRAPMHGGNNDTRDYFKYQIRYDSALNRRIPVSLGFRGEGRNFATVLLHQGARNRVDLHMLNMDQTWHPFSDPAVGNQMYFRRTAGDNCLYSVTSIADDFDVALGFPLIEDRAIFVPPHKELRKWTRQEYQHARHPVDGKKPVMAAKIRLLHDGRLMYGYALGTESWLYLVKVMGDAVHTQNVLGGIQCRERGVRDIPMADFMAGFHLRRIHYGPTRGHGIHAIVHETKYFTGAAWHNAATDQDIATAHFNGDVRAAGVFRDLVRSKLTEPDALFGEVIGHPNRKIYELVKWDVPWDEFHAEKDDPEIVWLPSV